MRKKDSVTKPTVHLNVHGILDFFFYRFSVDQAVSLWDSPYVTVISNIPSVIIRGEQRIFPGLSFLRTPSLLITDPQLISSAQGVIYLKCFMVSVSAVVDDPAVQFAA